MFFPFKSGPEKRERNMIKNLVQPSEAMTELHFLIGQTFSIRIVLPFVMKQKRISIYNPTTFCILCISSSGNVFIGLSTGGQRWWHKAVMTLSVSRYVDLFVPPGLYFSPLPSQPHWCYVGCDTEESDLLQSLERPMHGESSRCLT